MVAIKHELDTVQQVKEEIEELREYVDRLEENTHRRKLRLLEQVCLAQHSLLYTCFMIEIIILFMNANYVSFFILNLFYLIYHSMICEIKYLYERFTFVLGPHVLLDVRHIRSHTGNAAVRLQHWSH